MLAPSLGRAELAKATEIPHRGSLMRFCAADSAALEAAYRSAAFLRAACVPAYLDNV